MVTERGSGGPVFCESPPLRVALVIASLGRPDSLAQWRERIEAQTMKPSAFVYSVTCEEDLPAIEHRVPGSVVLIGPKGSCVQRNAGIDAVIDEHDVIAFFDDDYMPSRGTVEGVERLFRENPDIISANGHLIADGINSPGVPFEEAMSMLDAWDAQDHSTYEMKEHVGGLYGCNMVYRSSAVGDVRFDEVLPLYGWQEDVDFGARLLGRGRTTISNAFAGVHQGSKRGRTSGEKLGYAQVVNPFYLVEKGTMRWTYAMKIVLKNVLANHAKAMRPESWVDRNGRARGNRRGLIDMMRGKAHPQRIFEAP